MGAGLYLSSTRRRSHFSVTATCGEAVLPAVRRARGCEVEQRIVVACVRSAERRDVRVPADTCSLEIVSTRPVNRRVAKTLREKRVGRDPRVPPIAVWERVNPDQSVMETQRRLHRRERLVLYPVGCIIEKHLELDAYLDGIDTDVLLSQAERSGPSPHVPEQAAVQLFHELLGKDICLPPPREPEQALLDIRLL